MYISKNDKHVYIYKQFVPIWTNICYVVTNFSNNKIKDKNNEIIQNVEKRYIKYGLHRQPAI